MKTFFTSDTHFNHANIIKFCPETRPFEDKDHMNESLIENWNSTISNDDTVWHLGDVCFGSDFSFLYRLNGKINLIKGNHDHKMLKTHSDRFENIFDLKEIKINKKTIILCHYRMLTWDKAFHGSLHFFGHSHGAIPSVKNAIDVGIDNPLWYSKPVSFETIMDVAETLPEKLDNDFLINYKG